MSISLKESNACTEIADVLYSFLPGSGSREWKGHVTFQTVAKEVGVGDFWPGGSKTRAIASLLQQTLRYRRRLFEQLILTIVREGLTYRQKTKFASLISQQDQFAPQELRTGRIHP